MTTAREMITLALKEAGVTGVGQTPLAEDMNDGFTYLTDMLNLWQIKRWLVPGLTHIAMPGNNQQSNKIGPGQYYNALRPFEVQAAWFTQNNVGNGQPVSYPLKRIWSFEDYSMLALKQLNTWPLAFFYDNHYPYGNVYIWPIPSESYTINLVLKLPVGFNTGIADGEFTEGEDYTDGTYIAVPFETTEEGATGGTVTVTIAGGVVTDVEIIDGGNGYSIGNVLTIDNSNLGGTGEGFEFTVTNVEGSLDNELTMPPEYNEPVRSNLVIRLCAGYNKPANPVTVALARVGLNTIKKANSQIPTLIMPLTLRSGSRGFNIFNPDGGNINA